MPREFHRASRRTEIARRDASGVGRPSRRLFGGDAAAWNSRIFTKDTSITKYRFKFLNGLEKRDIATALVRRH